MVRYDDIGGGDEDIVGGNDEITGGYGGAGVTGSFD